MRPFTRRRWWGIYQPPYSPELNPAERVFEEVRRWVEGRRSEEGSGGRGATTVGSRGKGLIAGRVALHPSSFECSAFMIKNLCLWKWYHSDRPCHGVQWRSLPAGLFQRDISIY